MTPADPSAAAVPLAPAELEVLVRRVLADLALVEPISVDAETAAKLVGVCSKTLGGFPSEQTGRAKLGRRTVYELTRLRQFVRDRIGKTIET